MYDLAVTILLAISMARAAAPMLPRATPEVHQLQRRATSISVTLGTTFQSMDGFGVSQAFGRATNIFSSNAAAQTAALDLLFSPTKGAGFTILRNRIGNDKTASDSILCVKSTLSSDAIVTVTYPQAYVSGLAQWYSKLSIRQQRHVANLAVAKGDRIWREDILRRRVGRTVLHEDERRRRRWWFTLRRIRNVLWFRRLETGVRKLPRQIRAILQSQQHHYHASRVLERA
jgi:hypothetical protein